MAKWEIIEDNKFKKANGGKSAATRAVATKNSKNNPKMLSEVTVVEPKTVTKNKPVIQKPNLAPYYVPAQDASKVNTFVNNKQVTNNQPTPTPLLNLSNANSYNIPNLTGIELLNKIEKVNAADSDSTYYGVPYKNGVIADKKLWNENKRRAEEEWDNDIRRVIDIGQTAGSIMELYPPTALPGYALNAILTVPSLAMNYRDKNYVGIGTDVAGLVPSSLLPGGYGTAKTIGEMGYNGYNIYQDFKQTGGKASGWQIIDDLPKAQKGLTIKTPFSNLTPTQPVQEKPIVNSIPTTVKPQYKSEGDYLNQVYGEDSGVQLPGQSSILRASQDAKPAYDVTKKDYSSYNKEIQEQKIDEQVAQFLKDNPLPKTDKSKADYIENLSPYDRQLIQSSSYSNEFLPAFRQYQNRVGENAKKYSIKEAFSDPNKLSEVTQSAPNRFRLFPNATNSIEDFVNPGIWLGQMEQGVADIPKNIRDENYLGAAMGVVNPLAMGALGAVGTKSTGQWLNNMANPLAGIVDANTVKGLGNKVLNNYGREAFTPMLDNVGVEALGVGKQNIGSSVEGVENNLVTQLRKELEEKGIIESQKTINFPWKEPIRKGVEPWGYSNDNASLLPITGSKYKDVKGVIIGGKNPSYMSDKEILMNSGEYDFKLRKANDLLIKEGKAPIYTEEMQKIIKDNRPVLNDKNIKDAINHRDKIKYTYADPNASEEFIKSQRNRYATWDMYLGKPQTQHPMYDISELTKSKKDIVYTIKEDFMNKPQIETRLKGFIGSIERDLPGKKWTKKGDSWIIPDEDKGMFGTMGGFHWKVDKLNNGNYKIIANDVWDIQPFKNRTIGNSDKLSGRLLNKAIKPIQNIEVGKALGIGKPMNVKVGFEIDGNTKQIIKTFGLGGAVLGASALPPELKHGGVIEDPMGQWAHPGSITKIPSNQITMEGVNYPVLGVSDRGHTQMMYPGEDYSFRGKSVTEYPMMGSGGEVNFTYAGENHRVYEKESPTGNGKGIEGHIMVNHPTENKGKWDTIDLTKITNGKVKTVAQGVASTKKWHKENPEYADGGMIKRADGSYSKRGLWDNIRDNAGSGKKPTKEMLKQERKIKSQYANGGQVSSWEIIEDLPKAQTGILTPKDSLYHQRDKTIKYDLLRGGAQGNPLLQYSDTSYYNQFYKDKVEPHLSYYQTAMEKGDAGDFVFNSGRDPRTYQLDQYLKSIGQSGLPNRGSFNIDMNKDPQKWATKKPELDAIWNQYQPDINKLTENQRRVLLNKGRDFYYKNTYTDDPGMNWGFDTNGNPIRGADGSLSPAYGKTWYGRIWNNNDFKEFDPNNPKFTPPAQKPGQSVALPPQFQKGGKTKKSNWQIIEY